MIEKILPGDITHPSNKRDIIIGMNAQLQDVTGIGRKFVRDLIPPKALELGSVISFDFDHRRRLHMIICHHLGKNGWVEADKHVRFGMDFLNHMNDLKRKYSIVQIGTGRIGQRDGANVADIFTAMATSYLPVQLFIHRPIEQVAVVNAIDVPSLRPLRAWHPISGELQLVA